MPSHQYRSPSWLSEEPPHHGSRRFEQFAEHHIQAKVELAVRQSCQPVEEAGIVPGQAAVHHSPAVEEGLRTVPVVEEHHIDLVEVLHIDPEAALHTVREVVADTDLAAVRRNPAEEEGRHTGPVEVERRIVLVVVRRIVQGAVVGHTLAVEDNHPAGRDTGSALEAVVDNLAVEEVGRNLVEGPLSDISTCALESHQTTMDYCRAAKRQS